MQADNQNVSMTLLSWIQSLKEGCNPNSAGECDIEHQLNIEEFPELNAAPYEAVTELKKKIKETKYKLEKVYLTLPERNMNKILVTLYVDYGYTKPNMLKHFGEISKRHPEKTKIHVSIKLHIWNDKNQQYWTVKMLHSSKFLYHPVSHQPQLFLGLIHGVDSRVEYNYVITCEKESGEMIATSNILSFRMSVTDENTPYFLLAAADLHGGFKAWFRKGKCWCLRPKLNKWLKSFAKAAKENEEQVTFGEKYSFLSFAGDLVENGAYKEYWADLFQCMNPILSQRAFITSIGNHDYYSGGIWRGSWKGGWKRTCKNFHSFVQTPGSNGQNGHYFSLDVGNLHIVYVDSNTPKNHMGKADITCESKQWEWLKNDLALWRKNFHEKNGTKFCIVFVHSAIFSIGYFGRKIKNADYYTQQYLTPLFRKYGVNLCIFGHDHIYQRSTWKETTYLCLGLSGGIKIKYYKKHLENAQYTINSIFKGNKARGYSAIYVPPLKLEESKSNSFLKKLTEIEKQIIKAPIRQNFVLDEELAKNLDKNLKEKKEFVKKEITSRLINEMWIRYYTTDGTLLDHFFLKPNVEGYSSEGKEDYELVCPEKHIGCRKTR
ncbi:MAG: metallophosphoesterase family protein [Candidatus Heimdallarchaeaceae archaeon]